MGRSNVSQANGGQSCPGEGKGSIDRKQREDRKLEEFDPLTKLGQHRSDLCLATGASRNGVNELPDAIGDLSLVCSAIGFFLGTSRKLRKMNPWEILASIAILVSIVSGEEAKWIWGDGAKKKSDTIEKNARYQVYEYPNGNLNTGVRPQYSGPYGSESGPILPVNHGTQILVGPEGPTGIVGRPGINNGGILSGPIKPGVNVDPITVGSVPSWIKQDHRYREYDSCKCSYGFNCPGLKFGSCAKGKQYCCYDSRKVHGLAPAHANYNPHGAYQGLPFKPFNAIPSNYYGSRPQNNYENGRPIQNQYNGPYSPDYEPYDHNDSYESYERPHIGSHYDRPGYYDQGRPYATRPYDISDYARSNGSNKKSEESKGRSTTSNVEVSSTSTQSGSSASPSA